MYLFIYLCTCLNVPVTVINLFLSYCNFFRCDLSQGEWVRCNVDIQKICHFPVFGLKEGALYQFRVCAVNKAGVGRPSKATEPVLTADPLEYTRTMGITYGLHTFVKFVCMKWFDYGYEREITFHELSFLLHLCLNFLLVL